MSHRYQATSAYGSDQATEEWHLMRRLFLLLLLVLAISFGLVLLSRQRTALPPILFHVLTDASLGLIAGIGARAALRRPPWPIKAIASAAASILGLAIVGYLTNWKSGIGPFQIGMVTVHWLDGANLPLELPLRLGISGMDLLDLAHVAIAVDVSWLALRAWSRGPRSSGQTRAPASRQVSRPRTVGQVSRPQAAVQRAAVPATNGVARVRVPSRQTVRPRIRRGGNGRSLVAKAPAVRPALGGARRWSPLRRKPTVQLAVYEEHRCPYCLQEVSRNDPRGTVECPVCHTLHHKECWDITGTCQVPHLNN